MFVEMAGNSPPNQTSTHQDLKAGTYSTSVPCEYSLRGFFVDKRNKYYLHEPREALAHLCLKDGQVPGTRKESVIRNFFDIKTEEEFLSMCAHGCNSLPAIIPVPSSSTQWDNIQYMSMVRHTWYFNKTYVINNDSQVWLTDNVIELLKNIADKLKKNQSNLDEAVTRVIVLFFQTFGSHVFYGTYATGGRSVRKIGTSKIEHSNMSHVWSRLEKEFDNLSRNLHVDILPEGEEQNLLSVKREDERAKNLDFDSQICFFHGYDAYSDVNHWRKDLDAGRSLFLTGDILEVIPMPVWDIVKQHEVEQLDNLEILCDALKSVWSQLEHTSNNVTIVTNTATITTRPGGNQSIETTDNSFPAILNDLQLCKRKQGMSDATTLKKVFENSDGLTDNAVMWQFITSIFSLDCRGRKLIKLPLSMAQAEPIVPHLSASSDIFDLAFTKNDLKKREKIISAMDITLAILHCCDPFLRQEILWKMSECRLAVPILLPYLDTPKVEIQLWGLRKIYKSWNPRLSKSPVMESIVDCPLPIVSFLRLDEVPSMPKSRLLNKILGKLQGNSDHPFFVDIDEEPSCAKWSKGTVEAAWYLPEDTTDTRYGSTLLNAITFFNLRGDALKFPVQREFVCRASDVVVLFIEETMYKKYSDLVRNLSKIVKRHLICLISSGNHQNEFNTIQHGRVTLMFSKQHLTEVGAEVCKNLNHVLWSKEKDQPRFQSISSLKSICSELNIDIDEDANDCVAGKEFANNIIRTVDNCSDDYKETHLPLRGELWHNCSKIDKKWNKAYDHTSSSVEHYRANLKQELMNVREKQHRTEPSDDVVQFIKALKTPIFTRKYFVAWLNIYLNDFCETALGPKRRELQEIQEQSRVLTTKKRELNENIPIDDEIKTEIQSLEVKEISLQKRAYELATMIGKYSIGIEHFVREIGQHYEAYDELKGQTDVSVDSKINPGLLPQIAVKLLLDGHPLEILDGDVGQVPLRWLKAVFKTLIEELNNAKVCVISVLGIQSSGKSTLLNCMFGVRFAVSAGRCTRGVFFQLLKIHEDFQKELRCEYIIVIDTEGLKAPERSHGYDLRYDNELATFAICLADLTLINIAGHTVGKDMTDILQIAAHAFIRMKEVHIKSSCRIVQQFVADLGAVEKNKSSTLAILSTLDQAISAAASEEGYSNLYSCFSDVFNLNVDENIQYIPSLWQGAMAPPNHRYSEKILKLKDVLFQDLLHSGKTLSQFLERLTNVWKAVKEENFIFSFQNCTEAVQYKAFQHAYGGWVGKMREAIMVWESNAKQKIKKVSIDKTASKKAELKGEIERVVDTEVSKVEQLIARYLSNDFTEDEHQLTKFKEEFVNDLHLTSKKYKQDSREALDRIADSITHMTQMETVLPECRQRIREKAKAEAIELRKQYSDVTSTPNMKIKISKKFDELWGKWVEDICIKYPPEPVQYENVEAEFDSYLIQVSGKCDLSKRLKERLLEKGSIGKAIGHVWRTVRGTVKDPKEYAYTIIKNSLSSLQSEIDDDLAYDPQIKQKLIDTAINQLNKKYDGTSLTRDIKVEAMIELCKQAVPIIYSGRKNYDLKYSLQERLNKEKEHFKTDFIALCSNAFQDGRACESLMKVLVETTVPVLINYMGPEVYRAVLEVCPYFASKSATLGNFLEDIAIDEDFKPYWDFLFERDSTLENWTLNKIARICKREHGAHSFLYHLAEVKVLDVQRELLRCISFCGSLNRDSPPKGFKEWIEKFREELLRSNCPTLNLSDDDMKNLLQFEVKDLSFFGEELMKYVECQISIDVLKTLNIPDPELPGETPTDTTKNFLTRLPVQPHLEIRKLVAGCKEQCPICHAPCENMTKNHVKHRAELHYPEGLIGCATEENGNLVCSICTSIVTTNISYWDGKCYKKYKDYQETFPDWIIQPVQNDSPIKYWQWVMNRFNEDFAKQYGYKEARLPEGWIKITKKEAIEDLREAYATTSTTHEQRPN